MGVDDARDAHPSPGDLLRHQRIGEQGLAEPAVALVDRQAEDAEFPQPGHDLRWIGVGAVKLGGNGDDLRVHELADRAEDVLLQLGEAVGLGQARHGPGSFG